MRVWSKSVPELEEGNLGHWECIDMTQAKDAERGKLNLLLRWARLLARGPEALYVREGTFRERRGLPRSRQVIIWPQQLGGAPIREQAGILQGGAHCRTTRLCRSTERKFEGKNHIEWSSSMWNAR